MLLLFPAGVDDALGGALFERLAQRYRVVAPVVPARVGGAGIPLSRWLREVIDGLGLEQPTVVADESFAGALLGFSLVDPARIGNLIAICREDADPASSSGMLQSTRGLLVLAVDAASDPATSADAAVAEIAAFVS